MDGQTCPLIGQEQWRIRLREQREKAKMSNKQIADKVDASEKTIIRLFTGEAKNPGTDLVNRVIHALGTTWSEIFGESGAVIGGQDLVALQAEVDRFRLDIVALKAENDILKMELKHKDEIIALHNYYNKLKPNN
jgi:transcriptional regulator with XRE-family HTH domain